MKTTAHFLQIRNIRRIMINDPASMTENFVNKMKNCVPPEGWPIADNLIFSARSSFCILMYCCFLSVFRSAFTHQPSVKSLPGRQSHHFVLLWGFLKNISTNICLFSQLFLTWHTPSRHRLGYNPLTCYKTASTYPFLDTLVLRTKPALWFSEVRGLHSTGHYTMTTKLGKAGMRTNN